MKEKERVVIGIPCFSGVPPTVLQDYMRFAYYVGRRYPEYDFFLAIKDKSEQFRARNAIVQAALQVDADWLLMMDDDHIIDWEDDVVASPRYEFLRAIINHLKEDPKRGIVGALYYTRGGTCRPVLMQEGAQGGYFWMKDSEIKKGLMEVAVTGGGCFAFNMNVFSRIPYPWFEPEMELGTDIQICRKAKQQGYSVHCDTSIVLGHVMAQQQVVTPKNRHRVMSESLAKDAGEEGVKKEWMVNTAVNLYVTDALEYTGKTMPEIEVLAAEYQKGWQAFNDYKNKDDYYRELGMKQLARQVWFHLSSPMMNQLDYYINLIDSSRSYHGLDYCCGSAPLGFEYVLRGHRMDFVDLEGAYAYEFTKWRAKHRSVEERCGWKIGGPYDYVLMMDAIEHLSNWEEVLTEIIGRMKPNAFIVTNYFLNRDFDNVEHVSMDCQAVKRFLIANGVYPANEVVWQKKVMSFEIIDKLDEVEVPGMGKVTLRA